MGLMYTKRLMYTKLYLDFEPEEWTQISANPTTFQSIKENVSTIQKRRQG
jgi:hypothetical protein